MRVLMISRDPNVLKEGTPAFLRMNEYRTLVDSLTILLLTPHSFFSVLSHRGEYDLVTAQDPFETGLVAARVAKRCKANLELQVHTDFLSPFFKKESLKNKIRVFLGKRLLRKAACVRVVSKRIKRSLVAAQLCKEEVISVLPIFVDILRYRDATVIVDLHKKYTQFKKIILMASRIVTEKNISLALCAFKDAARDLPGLGLVIVGSGPLAGALEQEIKKRGLSDSVVFEPWTTALASYYKTADLFLTTSNYEGYSMTLIEAAASGCPIITTDVGLVGDLLGPEEVAVVPVGDQKMLSRVIFDTLADGLGRTARMQNAAARVTTVPTKEQYLQNIKTAWQTCGTVAEKKL